MDNNHKSNDGCLHLVMFFLLMIALTCNNKDNGKSTTKRTDTTATEGFSKDTIDTKFHLGWQ